MTTKVQSVLFDKNVLSKPKAEKWLRKHNFIVSPVHITDKYYRYRQFEPSRRKRHRVHRITNGIKFIFEY